MNKNTRRLLLSSVLLTSIFLLALVFNGNFSEAKVLENVPTETIADNQPLPNLSGDEAKEYLKEQGLYESLGEAMKAAKYSIYPTKNAPITNNKDAFEANNPRQAFSTYFAKDGIHLVSKAKNNEWRVQMNLTGYGYGDDIAQVEQITTEVQKNKSRIEIEKSATDNSKFKIQNSKSNIVEWYENSQNGLEQGWTISEKPAATNGGQLNLVLELGGDLKPKLTADKMAIDFVREKNEPVVRYDKLKSWDADGKELASRMELDNNTLSIVVDDAEAKYPITVDPFFTQTKKLVASDAAASDEFGNSVAISGDTAIVGAYLKDVAAPRSSGSKTANRKGLSSKFEEPDSPTAGANQGGMYIFNALAAPSAASASISGRLLSSANSGVANATVNLSDQNGNTRSVRTSSFGFFHFDEVEVGQSYTVTISSRRYFFSPQIVTVNDEIVGLNFTAQ